MGTAKVESLDAASVTDAEGSFMRKIEWNGESLLVGTESGVKSYAFE